MNVKLNPFERVMLQNLLAQKQDGGMALRMLRQFREKLCFTGQEIKDWKVNDQLTGWENGCDDCAAATVRTGQEAEINCTHRLKEYVLPKALEKLIAELLESKDQQKQLSIGLLSLWEKFCCDGVVLEPTEAKAD